MELEQEEFLQEKKEKYIYCEDNWSPSHWCNSSQSYGYEVEKGSKTSIIRFDNDKKKNQNICHRCSEDWIPDHKCRTNHTTHCKIINGKEV